MEIVVGILIAIAVLLALPTIITIILAILSLLWLVFIGPIAAILMGLERLWLACWRK